jgi:hypothetical protein
VGETVSTVVYLCKGDSPKLCKERFPDPHAPRFFLYEQVFELRHAGVLSTMPGMRLLTSSLILHGTALLPKKSLARLPPAMQTRGEKGTHVQPGLSGPGGKVEEVEGDADGGRVGIGGGRRDRVGVCARRGTREGEETVCVGGGSEKVGRQLCVADEMVSRGGREGSAGQTSSGVAWTECGSFS